MANGKNVVSTNALRRCSSERLQPEPAPPSSPPNSVDSAVEFNVIIDTNLTSDNAAQKRRSDGLKRGSKNWDSASPATPKPMTSKRLKGLDGTRKQPPRRCCSRAAVRPSSTRFSVKDEGLESSYMQNAIICTPSSEDNVSDDLAEESDHEIPQGDLASTDSEGHANDFSSLESPHNSSASSSGARELRGKRRKKGSVCQHRGAAVQESDTSSSPLDVPKYSNLVEKRIDKVFACRWATTSAPHSSPIISMEAQSGGAAVEAQTALEAAEPSTGATENAQSSLAVSREMEYLVKFKGESYRRLQWLPRRLLSNQKNDQGDLKIMHFHRKMTGGDTECDFPLSLQDEGNFLLYSLIDRIIAVRLRRISHAPSTRSDDSTAQRKPKRRNTTTGSIRASSAKQLLPDADSCKTASNVTKEYLVKWKLLGYTEATWEPEYMLTQPEDLEHINKFRRVNLSFEFPICKPPSALTMAADEEPNASKTDFVERPSKERTSGEGAVTEHSTATTDVNLLFARSYRRANGIAGAREMPKSTGVVLGETYCSDAVVRQEGSTRLWQMFLKRKLAADGTYIPSLQTFDYPDVGQTKHADLPAPEHPTALRRLMAHQQEGLKWLFFNTEINRHGSLLADEMGLGKTCQSIAFLEHFLDVMSAGSSHGCHGLVVVQKSVFENWRREFQVWTPHLNVLPLCGGRLDREIARRYEEKWMCPETGNPVTPPAAAAGVAKKYIKPDVVLVTYEGLRSAEFHQLAQTLNAAAGSSASRGAAHQAFKWSCVVVDECQKVKGGRNSVLLQQLAQLKRHIMILLTGTPIQNTTAELFPMLTLLHPTKFYYDEAKEHRGNNNASCWSAARFNARFSNIQEREDCMQRTEELHELMAPYILRREKAHVLKTLPPKTVKLIRIPLTLAQKRVYSALYHRSIRTKGLKLSNVHMQLRKCCIHPFLIEGMEELIFEGKITGDVEKPPHGGKLEDGSTQPETAECNGKDFDPQKLSSNNDSEPVESEDERTKRLFLESSGKLVLLKKMLESYHEAKRKILIFSFFKSALDLIEDFIALCKYPWLIERVDGQTTGEERQLAIDRFNTDDNRFLFLCTTRAGGLGINLTAASVVIHLDSDFNPQHDLQAQARCHRIGQNKNVDVFHFIAEHTYEDYMLFTIAGKKLGLEAVLLGRLDATKGKVKLDKTQEEKVLRKGVFAAIRDDDAARQEAAEFAQSSIEKILSTKSTTVTLEVESADESTKEKKNENADVSATAKSFQDASPRYPAFSAATFAITREDSHTQSVRVSEVDGLDENQPDFWVKVAQRLGPWTVEEEKTPELTRADRRRGRALTCRLGMTYYDRNGFGRRPRRDDDPNNPQCRGLLVESPLNFPHESDADIYADDDDDITRDDDEGTPSAHSNSDDEDESDAEESDGDDLPSTVVVKDDLELGSVSSATSVTKKSRATTATSRGRGVKQSPRTVEMKEAPAEKNAVSSNETSLSQLNWSDWSSHVTDSTDSAALGPALVCTSTPCLSGQGPSIAITAVDAVAQFPAPTLPRPLGRDTTNFPTGPPSALLAMDLLYRCLRALRKWRTTRVGETGGLRTDDIRDADRCSPWALPSTPHRTFSAADQLLQQSWLETLQEWRKAGESWAEKKNAAIDVYAQKILQTKRDTMEAQWMAHMQTMPLSEIKSKEQLVHRRRLGVAYYGDAVTKKLQTYCDEEAAEVLTGKHFSREFTIKKQTWIGAEDFCIKMVFIHLMARRYASSNPPPRCSVMRWPPPQLEINWALTTEVIKKLNKYTGGPERRRAAIHERFYNKLDSRWNHDDFIQEERDILAIACANGLAAHIVAEEMPGRSLERVKKGLKCPYVLREVQRQNLLIQQPVATMSSGLDPSSVPSGMVVNVISRFRSICREKGVSYGNDEDFASNASTAPYQEPVARNEIEQSGYILGTVGGKNAFSGLVVSSEKPRRHAAATVGAPACSSHAYATDTPLSTTVQRVDCTELPLVRYGSAASPFCESILTEKDQNTSAFARPLPRLLSSSHSGSSPIGYVLDAIALVLAKIGVPMADFEQLRGSLMLQPITKLVDLLKRLELVHRKYSTRRVARDSTPSSPHTVSRSSFSPPQMHRSRIAHKRLAPTGQLLETPFGVSKPSLTSAHSAIFRSKISMSYPASCNEPAPVSLQKLSSGSSIGTNDVSDALSADLKESVSSINSPDNQSESSRRSSSLTAAASALSASLQAVHLASQSPPCGVMSVVNDHDDDDDSQRRNFSTKRPRKPPVGNAAVSTTSPENGVLENLKQRTRHYPNALEDLPLFPSSQALTQRPFSYSTSFLSQNLCPPLNSGSLDGPVCLDTTGTVSDNSAFRPLSPPPSSSTNGASSTSRDVPKGSAVAFSYPPSDSSAAPGPAMKAPVALSPLPQWDPSAPSSSPQKLSNPVVLSATPIASPSSRGEQPPIPAANDTAESQTFTDTVLPQEGSPTNPPAASRHPGLLPTTASLRLSVADIHQRMQADPVFASRVIECIERLKNG